MNFEILLAISKENGKILTYNKQNDCLLTKEYEFFTKNYILSNINLFDILTVKYENGIVLEKNENVYHNYLGVEQYNRVIEFTVVFSELKPIINLNDDSSASGRCYLEQSMILPFPDEPKEPIVPVVVNGFSISEIKEILTPVLETEELEQVIKEFKSYKRNVKEKVLDSKIETQLKVQELKSKTRNPFYDYSDEVDVKSKYLDGPSLPF